MAVCGGPQNSVGNAPKACMSILHIFLTWGFYIYGQIDRNINRYMVFLSIYLLISVNRKSYDRNGLYQCIVLYDCLPSQGSLCQRSIIV